MWRNPFLDLLRLKKKINSKEIIKELDTSKDFPDIYDMMWFKLDWLKSVIKEYKVKGKMIKVQFINDDDMHDINGWYHKKTDVAVVNIAWCQSHLDRLEKAWSNKSVDVASSTVLDTYVASIVAQEHGYTLGTYD